MYACVFVFMCQLAFLFVVIIAPAMVQNLLIFRATRQCHGCIIATLRMCIILDYRRRPYAVICLTDFRLPEGLRTEGAVTALAPLARAGGGGGGDGGGGGGGGGGSLARQAITGVQQTGDALRGDQEGRPCDIDVPALSKYDMLSVSDGAYAYFPINLSINCGHESFNPKSYPDLKNS